jgi:outer membrane protein assembly factor BamD
MSGRRTRFGAGWMASVGAVALLAAAACGGPKNVVPTGVSEPDKFLYERGSEALADKKWITAREYFRRLVDGYPQSPYRPDAKLGVGDTYVGEGTTESLILGVAEYREFLTFYPTHAKADYAQYKLGMAYFKQMRNPQRDQTETREAIREFETFMQRYPNSPLKPEAEARLRESRDRLSTADYQVGYFYYRQRWYPGAIDRLKAVLAADPGFTNRDAVYYYLAESLLKLNLQAEAVPYLDRLVKEFQTSEYLEQAKLRLAEFNAAPAKPADPITPAADSPKPADAPKPADSPKPADGPTPIPPAQPVKPKPPAR